MINILDKHAEVKARKSKMDGAKYFHRDELKFREWDILTCICYLLSEGGEHHPKYATENESPDFLTFSDDGTPECPVEITEVLRPDYKRGVFWKSVRSKNRQTHPLPEPMDDVWLSLRKSIRAKAAKDYPNQTSLFVYFDVAVASFDDSDTPFEKQLLNEHLSKPFEDIDCFGSIFILSSDMERLVRLHPNPKTIIGTPQPDYLATPGQADDGN